MPIFDQGYQHWDGKLSGHAWRWLTIARQGVRAQMKNRWARMVALFALVPGLTLAAFLIIWGLVEQKSSLVAPLLPLFQGLLPPDVLAEGPKAYRVTFWVIAYQFFFNVQMTFTMILVLLVGPGLISQDLRFNAIPLYFSRPLRRVDYFLGKLAVIGFFLGMVTVVPALVAYLLGVAFSLDLSVAWETARVVAAAVTFGLVIAVSAGTLMLAVSSLTRNSRYVGVIWFGFWLVSNGAADILIEEVRQEWCPLVSYTANLNRLGGALLGTHAAWDQIGELQARATAEALGRPPPGMGPARRPGKAGPPPPGPPSDRGRRERPRRPGDRDVSVAQAMAGPSYPWYWSAAVLAGLLGLSSCILATRVKTLDRLR